MATIRKVQKKKTCNLLTLPEDILKDLNITGGDFVIIEKVKDTIVIKKIILNK